MYMVPPFLAYYGITTGNQSMLQEAYNQVRFYSPTLPLTGPQRQANRLGCTATISATSRPADYGSTSSWVRMAQIQDTGRPVRSSISHSHTK